MKPKTLLIVVLALAGFLAGFVFLRGPTPHIAVKPETLFHAGSVGITNTMLTSWLVVATMIITVFLATRRWDLVPSGVQNVVEAIVEAFYDLVTNVAGETNGRRFFPVVATIFFFVLASNWLSLLPVFNVIGGVQKEESGFVMEQASAGSLDINYVRFSSPGSLSGAKIDEDAPDREEKYDQAIKDGKSVGELMPFLRGPNTDLNTPLALAIVSAIAVETWGITSLGLFTYGRKFFNFGPMLKGLLRLNFGMFFQGFIDAFVGIIELFSELARLISFTFRLFGNMFAGEVVLLMFTFMTPLFIGIGIYVLELFIGVIQAFIFAMLTLVFGYLAVSHGEGEHEGEKHGAAHGETVAEAA